jgi:hypothetical protein
MHMDMHMHMDMRHGVVQGEEGLPAQFLELAVVRGRCDPLLNAQGKGLVSEHGSLLAASCVSGGTASAGDRET